MAALVIVGRLKAIHRSTKRYYFLPKYGWAVA